MHLPDPAAHTEIEASPRALLGPFVIERPIGSGGMGEVWRAVHRDEHVPVAIKVIGQHWARQPSYRQAFQREVRAIAGLVHPGIVAVHDQGVVGAAAARASGERLAADSPYLVMEYMPRGSLEGLLGALDWPLVRVLLREILEALAHAHARVDVVRAGELVAGDRPGLLFEIAKIFVQLSELVVYGQVTFVGCQYLDEDRLGFEFVNVKVFQCQGIVVKRIGGILFYKLL